MDQHLAQITASAKRILQSVPEGVTVVAAAKTRTPQEVQAVIEAGITHIGHNYVQEARSMIPQIGADVTWHLIGHLQRNKAKVAVQLFDVIETIDSLRLAREIDKRCAAIDKTLPVLIEINSGREPNKSGVLPQDADQLVHALGALKHLHVQGLMTMGPAVGDPENARPYFIATREIFERWSGYNLPHIDMRFLSMGMSNSYLIAIQEGANIVRIGSKLFGARA